jgi:hypothetical protein
MDLTVELVKQSRVPTTVTETDFASTELVHASMASKESSVTKCWLIRAVPAKNDATKFAFDHAKTKQPPRTFKIVSPDATQCVWTDACKAIMSKHPRLDIAKARCADLPNELWVIQLPIIRLRFH